MMARRWCPVPLLNGHRCKGSLVGWWSVVCTRHWAQVSDALKVELSEAKGGVVRMEITERIVAAVVEGSGMSDRERCRVAVTADPQGLEWTERERLVGLAAVQYIADAQAQADQRRADDEPEREPDQ